MAGMCVVFKVFKMVTGGLYDEPQCTSTKQCRDEAVAMEWGLEGAFLIVISEGEYSYFMLSSWLSSVDKS